MVHRRTIIGVPNTTNTGRQDMRTTPRIPNLTDLRAAYEADTDTLAIVIDGDGETIIEVPVGGRTGHAIGRIEGALHDLGCQRLGEWWAPGYKHGQIGHEEGPREIACYVSDVNPLTLLRAACMWARDNHDCHQTDRWLDAYLVNRGYATMAHAPVTP